MIAVLNKIASRDHNTCEDSVFVVEDVERIYGGVFDGCGKGLKSAWASQTFSYLFQKYGKNGDITSDGCSIKVAEDIKSIMRTMAIQKNSLWSTCMLFSYNKKYQVLKVRMIGDGYYFVNDIEYEINQNDKVDYFVDHIDDFGSLFTKNKLLEKYPQIQYRDVKSFRICSDGLKSIERSQFAEPTDIDPMALLLHPPASPTFLELKWNILTRNHFFITDDLSIISYVQD